jgi:hypothetical protein
MVKVPIQIRTHLIAFFYEEFKELKDLPFDKISNHSCEIKKESSIGKTVIAILQNQEDIFNTAPFFIYFHKPKGFKDVPTAHIYQIIHGKEKLVRVPKKIAQDLNYIFEDLFRFAFVNTVQTAQKYAPKTKVQEVIIDFMTTYNLEEYGFRLDSLRTLYNREIKKNQLTFRFQKRCSNRVLNFSF